MTYRTEEQQYPNAPRNKKSNKPHHHKTNRTPVSTRRHTTTTAQNDNSEKVNSLTNKVNDNQNKVTELFYRGRYAPQRTIDNPLNPLCAPCGGTSARAARQTAIPVCTRLLSRVIKGTSGARLNREFPTAKSEDQPPIHDKRAPEESESHLPRPNRKSYLSIEESGDT